MREGRLFAQGVRQPEGTPALEGDLRAQGRRPASARRSSAPTRRSPRRHLEEIQRLDLQEIEITEADLEGAFTISDIVDPRTGEVVLEGNEPLSPRVLSVVLAEDSQIDAFEVFFPERDEIGPMMSATVKKDTIKTSEEALIEIYRRMRPGRSADPGLLAEPLRGHVPELAEVRLLAGGSAQAQHQARAVHRPHREDPAPRRHRGGHRLPPQAAPQPARRGRHRPPRQPARPQRGRAAGEPVPHRPRPDGAGHQGEDERLPGDGHGHAPRPHQRQAGDGLDPRVLRVEPAQPVHGPDEPAVGDHPQAAPVRPGAGRPQPRAGRVRGARRAPDPLRPHLPHRDPGRAEHRAHLEPLLLRPHQRVRLHREPLPQGEGRAGPRLLPGRGVRRQLLQGGRHRGARRGRAGERGAARAERRSRPRSSPTASTSRPGRRTSTPSPRPTRSWTRRAVWSTSACPRARPATPSSPGARRSSTSTSRPSSWCRWPRP